MDFEDENANAHETVHHRLTPIADPTLRSEKRKSLRRAEMKSEAERLVAEISESDTKVVSESDTKVVPWMLKFAGGQGGIIPTWLRWFMIWQLAFISLLLVMEITDSTTEYRAVALGAVMGGFFFSWAPCHICRSIESLDQQWENSVIDSVLEMDWAYEGQRVVSSKYNWIGVVILLFSYSLFYYITEGFTDPELWFGSVAATRLFSIIVLAVFVIGGWSAAFLVQVSLLPRKMKAEREQPPSPWEHHMQPLRSLSGLFLVLSLYGAMVVVCVMVIALDFPEHLQGYAFILVIGVGLVDIFAFIYPQIGVHNQLRDYKKEYLMSVSIWLEEVMIEVNNDPTEENLSKFEMLMNMHDRINSLEEWPFNIEQLGTVLASVLLPMGAIIFEVYV